jgi:hypothetical protein
MFGVSVLPYDSDLAILQGNKGGPGSSKAQIPIWSPAASSGNRFEPRSQLLQGKLSYLMLTPQLGSQGHLI